MLISHAAGEPINHSPIGSMLCLDAFELRLFVNITTFPCAEGRFQFSDSTNDCFDLSNLTLSSPCEVLQVDEIALIGNISRTRIQYYSYNDQSGLEGTYTYIQLMLRCEST